MNFLNIAGIGALGTLIISSWNSIKEWALKLKGLVFVNIDIDIPNKYNSINKILNDKNNIREQISDRRYRIRFDHSLDLNADILKNQSRLIQTEVKVKNLFILNFKEQEIYWITFHSSRRFDISITYIRGFFNLENWLERYVNIEKKVEDSLIIEAEGLIFNLTPNNVRATESESYDSTTKPSKQNQDGGDESHFTYTEDLIKEYFPQKQKFHYLNKNCKHILNKLILWIRYSKNTPRKGIVFYGPPGTGKSSTALDLLRYVSKGSYYHHLSLSSLTSIELMSIKTGEFFTALIIDDIDRVYDKEVPINPNPLKGTPPSFDDVLKFMDGIGLDEGENKTLLIITCNDITKLSDAFKRKGRIDHEIYIGPIDTMEELEKFSMYLIQDLACNDIIRKKLIDKVITKENVNQTAADIKSLINDTFFELKLEEFEGQDLCPIV